MGRFGHIEVSGFRRLDGLDIELRDLNVLIGANGGGKTSFLDVFSLLAASASGGLAAKISEWGGINALLTVDRAKRLALELSAVVPPITYAMEIAPEGVGHAIASEMLVQQKYADLPPCKYIRSQHGDIRYFEVDSHRLVQPSWEYNPQETSLSQVPKMFVNPEDFRRRLASSTYYHALNVEPRSPVRLPQPLRRAGLPGHDGEDLVSCLFNLRETDRDRFETIEDALHAAYPTFDRLDFPPVAAGTLAMTWRDRNFSQPLYMHQLSEGMLRFLWLATLLQSPDLTEITLLDEPEISLHPELLGLLAGMMREASQRTQLIVATHADRLVRFLEPQEVITLDIGEDGMTKATWADQLDLDSWLSEYTLDEVWRLGRMGGRA